ncbi:hypothetical protein LTR93_011312 [Exophiala xenobiotica]|nr:hypothetical protein LTR93_011312 [Exophiala xenobiotica]
MPVKKLDFFEEQMWAFCLVYPIVALARAGNAFRRPFKSVPEALELKVPPSCQVLRLKFKAEKL